MTTSINTSSLTSTDKLLRAGIAAAKAGQRKDAQNLLIKVVEADEKQLLGWLWLCSVVDDLEDQQVCLENVLALKPDHTAARNRLDWVREKLADQNESAMQAAEASQENDLAQAEPSRPVEDIFADEYRCVYCAQETRPEDQRCRSCRQKLWVSIPRREKPSRLLRGMIIIQALNLLFAIAGYIILLVSLDSLTTTLFGSLAGGTLITAAFLPSILISAFLLIGLIQRWQIIFYLYLASIIIGILGLIGVVIVGAWVIGSVNWFWSGGLILYAMTMLLILFQLHEDLAHDKFRRTLRLDRGDNSAITFLEAGHRYAKRKMWGLAALHLRSAASRMSRDLEVQLALTVAYINLKLYDQASITLSTADQISIGNPKVTELKNIVAEKRKAAVSTS